MIVTCDHCSARYKLDPERIAGRGAKITCPRCKQVFVVYKDKVADEDEGQALHIGEGRKQSAPPLDVDTLDFRKVGIRSWKVKVKIGLVYDFSDYNTLARYIQDGRVTSTDKLSHDGAEWTEIGEIPNLKQHFVDVYQAAEAALAAPAPEADGTSDFDDDLPTNIVGMAELAMGIEEGGPPAVADSSRPVAPPPSPPDDGLDDGLAAATAAALAEANGNGIPPRFVDPFEQLSSKRKRSSGGRSPASGGRRPPKAGASGGGKKNGAQGKGKGKGSSTEKRKVSPAVIVLLLLLLGGGAYLAFVGDEPVQRKPVQTAAQQAQQRERAEKMEQARQEKTKAELEKKLMDEMPEVADGAEDEGWDVEDPDDVKIPVIRDRNGNIIRPGEAGTEAALRATPGGASRPADVANGGGSMSQSDLTATDHAAAGDDAARRGDWSTAAMAYRNAADLQPSSAPYNRKAGEAAYRTGDAGSAARYLGSALGAGDCAAHKWLGHLSRDQGDAPGAVGHYQSYLACSPRDAGDIQREIDKLNGS